MKVSELRELLQDLEISGKGDMEVVFSYNYGDYWRTTVACSTSDATEAYVKYSNYHNMDKVLDDDDNIYDKESGQLNEGVRSVIVLN